MDWTFWTQLSDVQKHALALARLSRFLKSSNTRQNDLPPIFLPLVAQMVSFATVFWTSKNSGLEVAKVSCKMKDHHHKNPSPSAAHDLQSFFVGVISTSVAANTRDWRGRPPAAQRQRLWIESCPLLIIRCKNSIGINIRFWKRPVWSLPTAAHFLRQAKSRLSQKNRADL